MKFDLLIVIVMSGLLVAAYNSNEIGDWTTLFLSLLVMDIMIRKMFSHHIGKTVSEVIKYINNLNGRLNALINTVNVELTNNKGENQ